MPKYNKPYPILWSSIVNVDNLFIYVIRLPKFKVEIKKMIVHILPPRVSSYLPCIDSSALASTWDRRESDVFMSSNHRASVIQESSNSNSEGIGLFEKSLIKLHDSNRSSLIAPIRNEIHTYEIPKRGSFEGMTSRGNIRKYFIIQSLITIKGVKQNQDCINFFSLNQLFLD